MVGLKCPVCGGEMVEVSSGTWRCQRCGLRVAYSPKVTVKTE